MRNFDFIMFQKKNLKIFLTKLSDKFGNILFQKNIFFETFVWQIFDFFSILWQMDFWLFYAFFFIFEQWYPRHVTRLFVILKCVFNVRISRFKHCMKSLQDHLEIWLCMLEKWFIRLYCIDYRRDCRIRCSEKYSNLVE